MVTFCQRAEYYEMQGISTEMVCHCSSDEDHRCTALNTLKAVLENSTEHNTLLDVYNLQFHENKEV